MHELEISWNFHCHSGIVKRNYLNLLSILLLLNAIHVYSITDKRMWTRDPIVFFGKFYFHFLTHSLHRNKSFFLSILRLLVEGSTLNVAFSPHICVMCKSNSESMAHFSLHHPLAVFLWTNFYGILG